jgi:hypothetical protein
VRTLSKVAIGITAATILTFAACTGTAIRTSGAALAPDTTPTVSAPPVAAPSPAPVAAAGPADWFGNGEYLVGTDVAAGDYRSPGPEGETFQVCSLFTEPAPANSLGMETSNGPMRITIVDGTTVKAVGCQPFVAA